jgi:hypothetical protein
LSKRYLFRSLDLLCLVTYRAVGEKENQLVAGEVDLQPNSRVSAMHREPEESPASFVHREVAAILILADLVDVINVHRDLSHGLIGPFIDILLKTVMGGRCEIPRWYLGTHLLRTLGYLPNQVPARWVPTRASPWVYLGNT